MISTLIIHNFIGKYYSIIKVFSAIKCSNIRVPKTIVVEKACYVVELSKTNSITVMQ